MPNLLPAHMVLVDALAELAVDEYLAERADEQAPAGPNLPDLDQAA
jgi:hypothetical protein